MPTSAPRLLFAWRKAIAKSDLPPTVRLVAHTLGLHMNPDGSSCHPGDALVAKESGLSDRSVRSAIGRLMNDGWLVQLAGGCTTKGERRLARELFPRIPTAASPAGVVRRLPRHHVPTTVAPPAAQVVTEVEEDQQSRKLEDRRGDVAALREAMHSAVKQA